MFLCSVHGLRSEWAKSLRNFALKQLVFTESVRQSVIQSRRFAAVSVYSAAAAERTDVVD